MSEEAVELVDGDGPVLLTCEHATERMPEGWRWPQEDLRLRGTHWAYDLGARELTLELAERLGAGAVLSRFSRLLVDANRPESSETLFLREAEGAPVALNTTHLDASERERRIEGLLRPYHAAADARTDRSTSQLLLSVHSFTPVFEGRPRTLEVGVLHDRDGALAERLAAALARASIHVALNEPYSGLAGLMYSADRHARAHGRAALELEVRQDLAVDPGFRARLAELVAAFVRAEDGR